MLRFLAGVITGAAAAVWFERANSRGDLDRRILDAQERATSMLGESRRALEEVRQDLAAALDQTRKNLEEQAERVRRGPEPDKE